MVAVQPHSRRTDLDELLAYVLERCGHDPGTEDGPAVCDICANIFTILVDRLDEEPETLH